MRGNYRGIILFAKLNRRLKNDGSSEAFSLVILRVDFGDRGSRKQSGTPGKTK